MAAIDFTTVGVWTSNGLLTFYLHFVMELKTRRVHFAGGTTSPNEDWMKQTAPELTNCQDGFLNAKQHLFMDRNTKYCESLRTYLSTKGVKPVRLPPRAPNMNAHVERFFGSFTSGDPIHPMTQHARPRSGPHTSFRPGSEGANSSFQYFDPTGLQSHQRWWCHVFNNFGVGASVSFVWYSKACDRWTTRRTSMKSGTV